MVRLLLGPCHFFFSWGFTHPERSEAQGCMTGTAASGVRDRGRDMTGMRRDAEHMLRGKPSNRGL